VTKTKSPSGSDVPTFVAGLADVGVMAGSAGDGNRVDAQAFIDQKPQYNRTGGERRSGDGLPMAACTAGPAVGRRRFRSGPGGSFRG